MQGAVQQDMRGVVDGVIALTPDAVPPMVILPLAVQFGITETRVCGDVLRRLYAAVAANAARFTISFFQRNLFSAGGRSFGLITPGTEATARLSALFTEAGCM